MRACSHRETGIRVSTHTWAGLLLLSYMRRVNPAVMRHDTTERIDRAAYHWLWHAALFH